MGLASLNAPGTQGALFQVVSHGLIAALLFFLLGVIEQRFGTSDITVLGGLAKSVPILSGFFLAGGMASLGLPGMSGFVSEFLAFLSLFQRRARHCCSRCDWHHFNRCIRIKGDTSSDIWKERVGSKI